MSDVYRLVGKKGMPKKPARHEAEQFPLFPEEGTTAADGGLLDRTDKPSSPTEEELPPPTSLKAPSNDADSHQAEFSPEPSSTPPESETKQNEPLRLLPPEFTEPSGSIPPELVEPAPAEKLKAGFIRFLVPKLNESVASAEEHCIQSGEWIPAMGQKSRTLRQALASAVMEAAQCVHDQLLCFEDAEDREAGSQAA